MKLKHLLLLYLIFFNSYNLVSQNQTVQKSFDKPVLMHYMPWFETPIFNGYWGWHWTMNNQNPDIIDANGNRQIASHYYPLIGPYSSIDPDVIEYHLLLMKYSGVDVLAVNWYGTHGTNGDINSLLNNSNAIINKTQELGMSFAIILEDRFSSSISDVQNNLSYANTNYFSKENYFRYGNENNPFLGIFGPITYQTESDWNLIMSSINTNVSFLTLWNQSDEVGGNGSGEYAWIYQDDTTNHSELLNNFYLNNAPTLDIAMGVSYPGFHDFYSEGNAGDQLFFIDHNSTQTLEETMQLVTQYSDNIDLLQFATWNDFGEGTMLEPTTEFGFSFLTSIQSFLGVNYSIEELQQIFRLYNLRKEYSSDPNIQSSLDNAYWYFSQLNPEQAVAIMDQIEGIISGAQQAPSSVCTSPASYSFDQEVTWYFDLTGNDLVTAGDDLFFYSWAPNTPPNGAAPLTYENQMLWSLTFVPTDYYGVTLADLEAAGDSAFWGTLTNSNGDDMIGTIPYAIKEQLRLGTQCSCLGEPSPSDNTFLINFGSSPISNPDSNSNYWTNVEANNSTYSILDINGVSRYDISTSGNFTTNNNSGFTNPDPNILGDMAISEATQSYLFLSGTLTGTVTMSCLDPERLYTLSIFGSRNTTSVRETNYTVTGATVSQGMLQTSGSGIATNPALNCNDDEFYVVDMYPNSEGSIEILTEINSGGYGYINMLKVEEIANPGNTLSVPQNENSLVIDYFPNPIKNNLQINVSNFINEPITIELFDTIGNSIMKFEKDNRNGKLKLTSFGELTNGVYYIKLSNKDTSQTIKIIKH